MKKAPSKKSTGKAIEAPIYAPDYGRVYVTENDIPEIKDWTPGETYEFSVKAEMTELSTNEYPSNPKDKDKLQGRFKIKKVSIEEKE